MTHWIELAAVGGCAVSGVLAASGKQVDLFGATVLAVVTAFGGGTLRDLMLGETPVFWLRDPRYLQVTLAAALFTFFAARVIRFPEKLLQIADAAGLALFTIIGARKAMGYMASLGQPAAPILIVCLGVVTGVAGGALRDILMREIPLVFRREIYLYATAATVGATLFTWLHGMGWTDSRAGGAGIVTILLLRLVAIRWRLSLPNFRQHDE
jgi:uncharacterized membrane protein YeiH